MYQKFSRNLIIANSKLIIWPTIAAINARKHNENKSLIFRTLSRDIARAQLKGYVTLC